MTTLEIVLLTLVIYLLVGIFSIFIPSIKECLYDPDISYEENNPNITATATLLFIFLWPIAYAGIIYYSLMDYRRI